MLQNASCSCCRISCRIAGGALEIFLYFLIIGCGLGSGVPWVIFFYISLCSYLLGHFVGWGARGEGRGRR